MAELVCIACPIGCRLSVENAEGGEILVSGNRCPKGEVYGREEVLAPKRTVTAVVRTDSPSYPYASVRTDTPLPRPLMEQLLGELYSRRIGLPVTRGAVMIQDFKETGVNVVFTRTLPPDEVPSPG
jgi:CxxC motif-containing protein